MVVHGLGKVKCTNSFQRGHTSPGYLTYPAPLATHKKLTKILTSEGHIFDQRLAFYLIEVSYPINILPRENKGTEREAQGVGRDMSCPRKIFLDERKSASETSAGSLASLSGF